MWLAGLIVFRKGILDLPIDKMDVPAKHSNSWQQYTKFEPVFPAMQKEIQTIQKNSDEIKRNSD
jgi:hypothetical protein